MALTPLIKKTYVAHTTPVSSANLNAIQDAVIELQDETAIAGSTSGGITTLSIGSTAVSPAIPFLGIGARKDNVWDNNDSMLLLAEKFNGGMFRVSTTSSSYPAAMPSAVSATTFVGYRLQFMQYGSSLAHAIVVLYEIYPIPGRIWIDAYNVSWQGWKEINTGCLNVANVRATNTRTAITPSSGSNYAAYGNSWYYKIGSRVHVHVGLQGLTANTNMSVTTLPDGYRPPAQICAVGLANTISSTANMLIQSNGAVSVYSSSTYACIDMEYDAF